MDNKKFYSNGQTDDLVSSAPADGKAFDAALAARIRDAIQRTRSEDTFERILSRTGLTERAMKDRLKGRPSFTSFELKSIIDVLNEAPGGLRWDANYMLMDETKASGVSVEAMFREIMQELRKVVDTLDDSPLGMDGVASRLAIDMVEDLRKLNKQGHAPFAAGLLMDREIEIIEPFSTHTKLVTNRLDYTVQLEKPGVPRPGRFLTLVAQNLLHGRRYTYILPGPQSDWDQKILHLRRLLVEAGVENAGIQSEYLQFRFTNAPIGAGFVLMKLDLERLRADRHLVYSQIAEYRSAEHPGVLGEIIPGCSRTHAASIMDAAGIERAVWAWNDYERESVAEQ